MDKYWSDKLAEELRPKLCAEQVEWFSFAHLSAALRKAREDGERIGHVKGLREAAGIAATISYHDEYDSVRIAELIRDKAARIERGDGA